MILDIARLRDLLAKATPGEWRVHHNPRYWIDLPSDEDGDPNRDNNAALVAELHNAAPELLDELERLRRELAEHDSLLVSDYEERAVQRATRAEAACVELETEVAELRRVARMTDQQAALERMVYSDRQKWERDKADRNRLRAALLRHGHHDDECRSQQDGPDTCDCGFDAALVQGSET